jgi:hypothetical protein
MPVMLLLTAAFPRIFECLGDVKAQCRIVAGELTAADAPVLSQSLYREMASMMPHTLYEVRCRRERLNDSVQVGMGGGHFWPMEAPARLASLMDSFLLQEHGKV